MATKLFTAVNSVKLSKIELNEVKVSSLKLSSIKLGSSTSNKWLMEENYFFPELFVSINHHLDIINATYTFWAKFYKKHFNIIPSPVLISF
jgi:hypothetical protein